MATVADVARSVVGDLSAEMSYLQAIKWVSERFQEFHAETRARVQKTLFGELAIDASVTGGLVTIANGSTALTGILTTFVAGMVGQYFRVHNIWYEIAAFTSTTELTLATKYQEADAVALAYNILPRVHSLITTARKFTSFTLPRLNKKLLPATPEEMDAMYPQRIDISSPRHFSLGGYDITNKQHRVEFYPYCVQDEIINYTYLIRQAELTASTTIPDYVDIGALKEGVRIDIYRFLMSEALRQRNSEAAAHWGNLMSRQETVWKRRKQELRETSSPLDSSGIQLRMGRGQRRKGGQRDVLGA